MKIKRDVKTNIEILNNYLLKNSASLRLCGDILFSQSDVKKLLKLAKRGIFTPLKCEIDG